MNMKPAIIRIPDLTELDKLDLETQLNPQHLFFEEEAVSTDEHFELATVTAVVVVSLVALRALSIWLSKPGQKRSLEIEKPDGTKVKINLESSGDNSKGAYAEILSKLGSALNIDISSLINAER